MVGIFVASGTIPHNVQLQVMQDSPGADVMVASLNVNRSSVTLTGPGTYRVVRPDISGATSTGVGVWQDT